MKTMSARNPKIIVVGLGLTGVSCVRHLVMNNITPVVVDTRAAPPGLADFRAAYPKIELHLGKLPTALLQEADQILLSPGVALQTAEIEAAQKGGVEVIGDIELFARAAKAPVVAITGSNGKSTVTTLVAEMAKRAGLNTAVGGNLGTPALALLRVPEPDIYVLELSSFQLETTSSLVPAAATVLNISPDHMDRYATVAEYASAKQRIFLNGTVEVVNEDDPLVMAMVSGKSPVVSFSLNEPSNRGFGVKTVSGQRWLARGDELLLAVSELRIAGDHNVANALAALALGSAVNLPMSAMLSVLREFTGLPHRTQLVAEKNGIRFYNDSKGTNVGATLAAIAGLPGPLVLIVGGEGKDQDFAPLRDALAKKVRAVVLIGRDALLIEKTLAGVVPVTHAQTMALAVNAAANMAQPGTSVLLSPACASFDMFQNYAHRGDVFAAAARDWVMHGN